MHAAQWEPPSSCSSLKYWSATRCSGPFSSLNQITPCGAFDEAACEQQQQPPRKRHALGQAERTRSRWAWLHGSAWHVLRACSVSSPTTRDVLKDGTIAGFSLVPRCPMIGSRLQNMSAEPSISFFSMPVAMSSLSTMTPAGRQVQGECTIWSHTLDRLWVGGHGQGTQQGGGGRSCRT